MTRVRVRSSHPNARRLAPTGRKYEQAQEDRRTEVCAPRPWLLGKTDTAASRTSRVEPIRYSTRRGQ